MMVDFVGVVDVDLELSDVSVDPLVSVERRVLSALTVGTDPLVAKASCSRLTAVLKLMRTDLSARLLLADLLEAADGSYLRSIYFAQAGRGIGLAIANLEWLGEMLSAREQLAIWADQGGRLRASDRTALDAWRFDLPLVVDRDHLACGASLGEVQRGVMPVCGYDLGLLDVSLRPKALPLVRALAGLTVGLGIDDAHFCVVGVLQAIEELRLSNGRGIGLTSEILGGPFDDYQRALFFACAGRRWFDIYAALGTLRELCEARIALWCANRDAGIDGGRRVSPYVAIGSPEACLFADLSGQAARYSA